ncbi:MAG: hypothetical protein V4760_11305, partial [Bdellovibrionota bacterium]
TPAAIAETSGAKVFVEVDFKEHTTFFVLEGKLDVKKPQGGPKQTVKAGLGMGVQDGSKKLMKPIAFPKLAEEAQREFEAMQ